METESNSGVKKAAKEFYRVLTDMVNAKKIEFGYGEKDFVEKQFSRGKIYVSKNVLKDEALLRELLREIQNERKKRKLVVRDKILLHLDNEMMKKFVREIKEKVGAKEIRFGSVENEFSRVKLDDITVKFKFTLMK